MGSLGAVLLVKSARERAKSGPGNVTLEGGSGSDKWQSIQTRCLKRAHELLRRKSCPIEVRYEEGADGPKTIRACLYDLDDPLCAVPVGALGSGGTGGEGSAVVGAGGRCALRPAGGADSFRLRVYRPGPLLDTTLHDGVEVRRGDRLVVVASAGGQAVRCFAEAQRGVPGCPAGCSGADIAGGGGAAAAVPPVKAPAPTAALAT
eukprot:CAMPEP_0179028812 /NCGR_PEP_ID=MMETSP0796-20121207/9734_1 /TAXON_ID=73915 /ORGANISM="Pyrodinium bahamense, Strain pbaha01" /LENGTH=204 /DNA_ID=CAMNT_0020724957 /DNA_START=1 /DNA_END=615 /DNA_ORIENTATION=-